ncbi:23S rRNA (adenine(1618)-N(6))-methyltransferase RlmF [Gilliamella apicola]|uniref:Ribosomal RNA large subunit methyltransferase F n=1 Tax=Gilliamella apicola TaxID=1196095 RepID=A0A556RTQ8_9GAMM|nr:23S rRNA (adenine(1618)-N(6))-methyltransferase RlmF [Gilliamella apicola]TSJ92291.1 23S rRNA (adenine(1618)-N(6))-methyltransferase RlmF [Gilliamella apicola]
MQSVKKNVLHHRNKHINGYPFDLLIKTLPELTNFVKPNQFGRVTIDFTDPLAVKTLNKALLLHYYQLSYWDIPDNYLCPPIPGRADYIHYLADLLAQDNQNQTPIGKQVRILDIGVGANAIYPIIGCAEYGWSFVGSDINPTSIKVASLIAKSNELLKNSLQCRLQPNNDAIFENIIKPKEFYLATLCNPPFHNSKQQAQASAYIKLQKLGKLSSEKDQVVLNFGGQHAELWCKGGESAFVARMIKESVKYKTQCLWFTSLVSKKESLSIIKKQLKNVAVTEYKIVAMAQGQKISRFAAWTFFDRAQQKLIKKSLFNFSD